MSAYVNIADAAAAESRLSAELAKHMATSKSTESALRAKIDNARQAILVAAAGIDLELIAKAESVLDIWGKYANAGEEKAGVLRDAIAEISIGEVGSRYTTLWQTFFGTKDYDRWSGQRCDCTYGMGPRHGCIVFSIGLRSDVRCRAAKVLTEEERIACVYYLVNLEAIQAQRSQVAA